MAMTSRAVPEVHVHSRHRDDCEHKDKGSSFFRCACPKQLVWSQGGKLHRVAAQTFDWREAEKKAAEIHEGFQRAVNGEPAPAPKGNKSLSDAIELFLKEKQFNENTGKPITDRHKSKLSHLLNKEFLPYMIKKGILNVTDVRFRMVERLPHARERHGLEPALIGHASSE